MNTIVKIILGAVAALVLIKVALMVGAVLFHLTSGFKRKDPDSDRT